MIRQVGVTFLAFVLIFSSFVVTGVETAAASEAGPPYPGGGWEPQSASYGIVEEDNISIEMSDGTKLLAKIYRPADLETGEAVDEEFPVILSQTPYKKSIANIGEELLGVGGAAGYYPYLIERGYINVIVDVRGTGSSAGTWEFLGERERQDGVELVDWSAEIPGSNGRVGLAGASYLGINQLITAGLVDEDSPLEAIFPEIASHDLYRDAVTQGGIPDALFALPWLGLRAVLDTLPGDHLLEDPKEAIETQIGHMEHLEDFYAPFIENVLAGGDKSFDSEFWEDRSPKNYLAQIVENDIPAFMVGGWHDLFQRGSPMNYSGLQNASVGRPIDAPMLDAQEVTGKYQLVMGQWYHTTALVNDQLNPLRLQWFDKWLKDVDTGIEQTDTPLHVFEMDSERWVDTTHYPFHESDVETYYFGKGRTWDAPSLNDGYLSEDKPTTESRLAKDTVLWNLVSSPFSLQTEQWSMGLSSFVGGVFGLPEFPMDDRSFQMGGLTYTTEPLEEEKVIAGPINVTLYAKSTKPNTQFVVTVQDIAPNKVSKPITSGAIIGNQRTVNEEESWYDGNGELLIPHHSYTEASQHPVPKDSVERYDIEVFPTMASIEPGHRIRVTITTADTPHLLPTIDQHKDLRFGRYQVMRTATYPSHINLPLSSPGEFEESDVIWGPNE